MKAITLILVSIFVLLIPALSVCDERMNISITNVYDVYVVNPDLESHGGFGCVIKTPEMDILFDTGYDRSGHILLSNMEKMNINPEDIDIVVIFHHHLTKVLEGFLKKNANVKVYVPTGFPGYILSIVEKNNAEYLEVDEFTEIAEKVYSTGSMEGKYDGLPIKEQSLVIDTEKGLVVITGCAHQGIINVLEKIKDEFPDKKIYLLMGGFGLRSRAEAEIESIMKEIRKLGVKKVSPCSCSGDYFRELAKKKYKKNYIEGGVGQVISF